MSHDIPKKRGLLILDWYVPINILLLILTCLFHPLYIWIRFIEWAPACWFQMIYYSDKTIKTGELIAFNMPKSVRFIPEKMNES